MPRFTVLETSALFSNRVKYDYLFEMEMWLKGVERFFVLDHLPLSAFERSHASLKNFVEEVAVVRSGISHLALLTTHLLGEGKEDLASFLLFLDSQVSRASGGAPVPQRRGSAETELALVVEKLDDFSKVLDELSRAPFLPLQTYLSLGRIVVGTLKSDPNLGVLFRENLRPVLDRESKQSLARVLAAVSDANQKSALAALFVELFKGLRWTERIRQTIESPATIKRALLVFSLIRAQATSLGEFIRKRLLPRFPEDTPVAAGLERLVFSVEMEMRKVMELELVDVALMKDPKLVYARMEDASGILKDLFQQSVIGLAETFSSDVDGRALFPEYRTKLDQSLRLRDDLWELLQAVQAFSRSADKKALKAMIDSLDSFRRGSMKHLMFKDWSLFDRFHSGFSRERSPRAFLPAAHQFEVFLKTLVREVSKRSVLSAHPFRGGRPRTGEGAEAAPPPRYN
ncbi:MAG TPA: hypothetical protein PKA62_13130 [Thermoanaerobaculia bacterium]|nr:hypothetical protein [Thermoanaerobaculia bacterium]